MARRFVTQIGVIRADRFEIINSHKEPVRSHNFRAIHANRPKPAIRNFSGPKRDSREKRRSIQEPSSDSRESPIGESLRANRAIKVQKYTIHTGGVPSQRE